METWSSATAVTWSPEKRIKNCSPSTVSTVILTAKIHPVNFYVEIKGIPPCLRSSFLTASTPPVFSMKSYMTFDVSLSFSWASEIPHISNRFFSSGSKLFTCKSDTVVLNSLECGDIFKISFVLGEKKYPQTIQLKGAARWHTCLWVDFSGEKYYFRRGKYPAWKSEGFESFPPSVPLPILFYSNISLFTSHHKIRIYNYLIVQLTFSLMQIFNAKSL